jgi:integration host factor subunit alpha
LADDDGIEGMALTKAEVAEHLFEELGLNKREAKDLIVSFFEEIRTALGRGEEFKLSGFGNFELRDKERPGTIRRPGRKSRSPLAGS